MRRKKAKANLKALIKELKLSKGSLELQEHYIYNFTLDWLDNAKMLNTLYDQEIDFFKTLQGVFPPEIVDELLENMKERQALICQTIKNLNDLICEDEVES